MATENVAPNQFDDVPLSQMKQSAFEVPEEADASVAPDAEASLPLNDRLKTSKPGIRKQAYCELGSLLEASTGEASLFEEYAPMLVGDKKTPGLLHDKASLCHDGALSVVLAFAHHGPKETVTQRASVIVDAVVDKHLSQARLETKALDVLLALVDAGAAAQVQDSLVKGAAHKVPKTCAAAAKALGTLLRARAGSLDTRALASDKNIKALVEHRDKVVRGEGTALAELLMGGGGSLKDLKKFTALEPPKGAAGPADAEPFLTPVPAPTPILPVEAFDLLGKLPRTKGSLSADKWVKSLGEKEWKTRVAAAETVLTLAGGKELLASGDYTEVTKGLKGLLADSNVKVVATAINALGALARGLGRQYAQYAKKVAGTILEKGADKDRNVLSAVSSTLRTFSIGALLPAEMLECAGTALASPNPKVKVAALQWTIAAATATSAEPGLMRKAAAAFQDAVAPLTDDGSSDVRSAAFAALAGVHSAIGGDASAQHLDRLAPKKSQRVRELLGSPPQAPETANDGSARPRPVGGGLLAPGLWKLPRRRTMALLAPGLCPPPLLAPGLWAFPPPTRVGRLLRVQTAAASGSGRSPPCRRPRSWPRRPRWRGCLRQRTWRRSRTGTNGKTGSRRSARWQRACPPSGRADPCSPRFCAGASPQSPTRRRTCRCRSSCWWRCRLSATGLTLSAAALPRGCCRLRWSCSACDRASRQRRRRCSRWVRHARLRG